MFVYRKDRWLKACAVLVKEIKSLRDRAAHSIPLGFVFYMSYRDLLNHPKWQRKRLRILDRDQWTCRYCRNTEQQLHVHHIIYEHTDPWETQDKYLITLCHECHEKEESLKQFDWYELVRDSGLTRLHTGRILCETHKYFTRIDWQDVKSVDDFIKHINHG